MRERSDEATRSFLAFLDCFAEPVIGRRFANRRDERSVGVEQKPAPNRQARRVGDCNGLDAPRLAQVPTAGTLLDERDLAQLSRVVYAADHTGARAALTGIRVSGSWAPPRK